MCTNCQTATEKAHWGLFQADCMGCRARMLAAGPEFWQSSKDGTLSNAYMVALKSIWGANWRAGHDQVKQAAAQEAALVEMVRLSEQAGMAL